MEKFSGMGAGGWKDLLDGEEEAWIKLLFAVGDPWVLMQCESGIPVRNTRGQQMAVPPFSRKTIGVIGFPSGVWGMGTTLGPSDCGGCPLSPFPSQSSPGILASLTLSLLATSDHQSTWNQVATSLRRLLRLHRWRAFF